MTRTLEQREILQKAAEIKLRERKARKASKREVAIKPRQNRERDPGFLAYLRRQPCDARGLGGCSGAIQAAHIRLSIPGRPNPGMQRKADDRHATALCEHHHLHDQHKGSERAFWDRVGKDPFQTAADHFAAYLNGQST